jgi:glycosyltransferase involved in cell wall biosynthesis
MSPESPIRILHLANNLSNHGNGIVNVAVDLAVEQTRRGNIVAFASGGGGYETLLRGAGVQCLSAKQTGGAASAVQNSFGLLSILRQFKPHLVHAHMRNGLALVLPWARLFRIPVIMHLHNIHDQSYGLMHWPQCIIAVSTAVQAELLNQGVPADRIRIVLNGTLGSQRRPSTVSPAELKRPSIVTVAGMMHRKGIAELIEAFAKLPADGPQSHLYLVGGGSEQSSFQELASRSGAADRIHFEGFQADPRPYLQSADLFVLASRRESFALALLEAREAGCAILATAVDGIPESLEHGRCGVLVPPQDPTALAAEMVRILRDRSLQQSLRSEAKIGLERFTVSRMVDEVSDIYGEIFDGSRAAGSKVAQSVSA